MLTKYYSGDQIKKTEKGGARRDSRRRAYGILVGKTEGKSPLERPRRRFDDNIKINIA
jgi:hypothetical protein